eukprot:GHVU01036265.1.p1 GENE.GHVU01036265.1~~GHVU01036265.1.p1  ORF type:complete len:245 (-),score=57.45 GHVU01036265.1:123-857(-)
MSTGIKEEAAENEGEAGKTEKKKTGIETKESDRPQGFGSSSSEEGSEKGDAQERGGKGEEKEEESGEEGQEKVEETSVELTEVQEREIDLLFNTAVLNRGIMIPDLYLAILQLRLKSYEELSTIYRAFLAKRQEREKNRLMQLKLKRTKLDMLDRQFAAFYTSDKPEFPEITIQEFEAVKETHDHYEQDCDNVRVRSCIRSSLLVTSLPSVALIATMVMNEVGGQANSRKGGGGGSNDIGRAVT